LRIGCWGEYLDEVTGKCRKLHNEELNDSHSNDKFKKNEMGGTCSTYGDRRSAYGVLVGKPEGKNYLKDQYAD
jgi:hypothetical protein